MLQSGRVTFGAMDAVTFGRPAAEVLAEEARRCQAERVFLMASGTLNRTTDEIQKVRRALGNRFAGLFDRMPPHTPRRAVIDAAAAAREAGADLTGWQPRAPALQGALSVVGNRADDAFRRRIQRYCRRYRRTAAGQRAISTPANHPARRRPRPRRDGAHARMAMAVDRHPRCRSLCRGHLLSRGQSLC